MCKGIAITLGWLVIVNLGLLFTGLCQGEMEYRRWIRVAWMNGGLEARIEFFVETLVVKPTWRGGCMGGWENEWMHGSMDALGFLS